MQLVGFFFVRYYVDDGILVEVQWFPGGRRCIRALQTHPTTIAC